jgi:hypothetical protein
VSILKGANLVLRFLLELCALAALCYWGFKTGTGSISKAVLGIGAPLAAAVLWGLSWLRPLRYRCPERCVCSWSWRCSEERRPRCTPPGVLGLPGRWGWLT